MYGNSFLFELPYDHYDFRCMERVNMDVPFMAYASWCQKHPKRKGNGAKRKGRKGKRK